MLFLWLTEHAMKLYGGSKVQFHAFVTKEIDSGER